MAVPAAFTKTWLEQKLHGHVTRALGQLDDERGGAVGLLRVTRVEYVVEGAA